jgi:hypothetical protein
MKYMRCSQESEAQKLACKFLQLNMNGPRTLRVQVPGYRPANLEYSPLTTASVGHGHFFQVIGPEIGSGDQGNNAMFTGHWMDSVMHV